MRPQPVIAVFSPAAAATPPAGSKQPAPGAYDLVDFATVLNELDIKDAELSSQRTVNFLARIISDVSARISKYCGSSSEIGGRIFQVEGLTELIYLDQDPYPYQTPGGLNPLQLSRWPLQNLTVLTANQAVSGTALTFTVGAVEPPSLAIGQPVSHANIAAGTTVAGLGFSAPTLTVTLSAPLQLPINPGDAVLFGMSVAQTTSSGQLTSLGPLTDYNWVSEKGSLLRLNAFTGVTTTWEALPTTVAYYAGYNPLPADIVGAALEWLTMRWWGRLRDPMLRSETEPGAIGSRTYWVGGPPSSGSVPDSIRGVLDGYRERIIA